MEKSSKHSHSNGIGETMARRRNMCEKLIEYPVVAIVSQQHD